MFPSLALWQKLILSWLLAFLLALALTPPVRRLALRVGAVDQPGEARRVHTRPIPRLGGLTIFLGFVTAMLLFADRSGKTAGLLLGAVVIAVMGAVDDLISLNPWIKLTEQIVAALVAVRCGVMFDLFPSQPLSAALTVLWLVACTNAVNLVDGLDGLAAGLSLVGALTMLLTAARMADGAAVLPLAALAGACLGFLPYNLNPASIFMGDVGSQLLGYLLAAAAVPGLFRQSTPGPVLVPLFAMALPLSDTAFAFFRRILRGQSPFRADRGHLHHRLLALGLSQKQAATLMVGTGAALGLSAVLLSDGSPLLRTAGLLLVLTIFGGFLLFRGQYQRMKAPSPQGKSMRKHRGAS